LFAVIAWCSFVDFGRSLKDHAVAASHHDATLNNGATPYTTSVDSTAACQPSVGANGEIELRNCPFHRVARAHQDIVCGLNLRLIQGLIEESGGDDRSQTAVASCPAAAAW